VFDCGHVYRLFLCYLLLGPSRSVWWAFFVATYLAICDMFAKFV
jgi:hypothetical protein